jgi:hypothetical protein
MRKLTRVNWQIFTLFADIAKNYGKVSPTLKLDKKGCAFIRGGGSRSQNLLSGDTPLTGGVLRIFKTRLSNFV